MWAMFAFNGWYQVKHCVVQILLPAIASCRCSAIVTCASGADPYALQLWYHCYMCIWSRSLCPSVMVPAATMDLLNTAQLLNTDCAAGCASVAELGHSLQAVGRRVISHVGIEDKALDQTGRHVSVQGFYTFAPLTICLPTQANYICLVLPAVSDGVRCHTLQPVGMCVTVFLLWPMCCAGGRLPRFRKNQVCRLFCLSACTMCFQTYQLHCSAFLSTGQQGLVSQERRELQPPLVMQAWNVPLMPRA